MAGLYETSFDDLASLLEGEPEYRARQIWDGLYRRLQRPDEMTDLPMGLRERVSQALPTSLELAIQSEADGGSTVKWLWSLEGGVSVETVLMVYRDRVTVCVSTQAGCAMGCEFCATGQSGFRRHLTSGEIVEQVVEAARAARPRRLSHVVFMGMGEPLANYDRTLTAVRRLHGDVGISARRLTISTVGIVPGIRRLASEALPVNLAVSLHAANDELRDSLVPINRRYPLGSLSDVCAAYVEATGRRLSFEWALIDGVNDRASDIEELSTLARALAAHVNLIPLNPTPGYAVRGSPRRRVREFREALANRGVNATVRATRGTSISAACGQLAGDAASATPPGSLPQEASTPRRPAGTPPRSTSAAPRVDRVELGVQARGKA
ncbi:MAG: 23S rRNA (adenine(2503)-C(2))-methyltransferase RlmN [Actinomycetota bacterium]|nr:23S rRNA (adenine(2503)-C(2))-methyltransferase RlmN [Actinomycetota bacterium]